MDSQHGRDVSDQKVIYFNSSAKVPYCKLSNFFEAPIEYQGIRYASTEHAFQAARVKDIKAARMLAVSGTLGSLTEEAFAAIRVPNGAKKVKYWSKKSMCGIVPKMFIKRLAAAKKHSFDEHECASIFTELLFLKFRTHPELRKILLDTGDSYLLEFDRSAHHKFKKSPLNVVCWAGMVVEGKVVGHNQMGFLMMRVRETLRAEA